MTCVSVLVGGSELFFFFSPQGNANLIQWARLSEVVILSADDWV